MFLSLSFGGSAGLQPCDKPLKRETTERQRRAPIPAQGKALGPDRATAQGLKARPTRIQRVATNSLMPNLTRYRITSKGEGLTGERVCIFSLIASLQTAQNPSKNACQALNHLTP